MKRLLSILLLSLWAVTASAGTAQLTWTQPTRNTDGTTIPATGTGSLTGNGIYYGLCGSGTQTKITIAPATSYSIPNLGAGNWCFQITAISSLGESAPTGIVQTTFVGAPPASPTNLTIQGTTVYTIVKKTDGFLMLPVGTAPAGTACITTQRVNEYYVIPRASVTFSGTVRPDVVVAICN